MEHTAPRAQQASDGSEPAGADTRRGAARSGRGLLVTSDLPGIGGRVRERAEDFLVDEIPAYDPCGTGEHIYLLVQKREFSTLELVTLLANHFRVDRRAIGYAGLKDKHAITRQVVSIHAPGRTIEDFPALEHDRVSILWSDYHANKLRPGHLKGNRFSIRIRGVRFQDAVLAKRVVDRLERVGVPNRVGEQRFGMLGNNHLVGRAFIAGDAAALVSELLGPNAVHPEVNARARALYAEGKLVDALDAFPRTARAERAVLRQLVRGKPAHVAMWAMEPGERSFYAAAFQSAVFNAVLDERIRAGTLADLVAGDLAFKHENGAVFAADAAVLADAATNERLTRLEISASGPMWGPGMTRASGAVDAAEVAALEALGVSVEQIRAAGERSPGLLDGKRRPLRVPLRDSAVEGGVDEHGPFVRVAFELPRGAFATAVLPEIMKGDVPAQGEEHE